MKNNLLKIGGSALAISALLTFVARADQQFNFGFDMPVQANVHVSETGCDNSPGPWVTVEGEIVLGGLTAELIFQNNLKGTHSATNTYSTNIVLVLPGGGISIPKQPVLGGVGGNPFISIQFLDGNGAPLGDEILLGRCVQGLTLTQGAINQVLASTYVVAGDCSNSRGPTITFGGNLTLSGLKARLIFRNNLRGTQYQEAKTDIDIIVNGTQVQIPKQPSLGGAGGNPLIWLQFKQGDGTPIGDPIFLGRCNRI